MKYIKFTILFCFVGTLCAFGTEKVEKTCLQTTTSQHHQVAIAHTQSGDIQVGIVQLWDNGPWFAEFNVGAKDVYDVGGYFTWGGVEDRDLSTFTMTQQDIQGTPKDAATVSWGSEWVMPSSKEIQALLDNCECLWYEGGTSRLSGLIFKGKNLYSQDSIFFPLTGNYTRENDVCFGEQWAMYWTSTPYDIRCDVGPCHYCLFFTNGSTIPVMDKELDCEMMVESIPVRAIYRGEVFSVKSVADTNSTLPTKHIVNGRLLINTNSQTFDALGREQR